MQIKHIAISSQLFGGGWKLGFVICSGGVFNCRGVLLIAIDYPFPKGGYRGLIKSFKELLWER